MINLLSDIQYLKLLTKFHIKPSIETQFQIRHCRKSLIDLDQIIINKNKDNHMEMPELAFD